MADWTDLEPMDQVSFWIGRVSRADSTMEAQLHHAYEQLAGPSEGLGWAAVPRMMGGKLQGIKDMLKASDRPRDEIAECARGLRQIEDAHAQRNALVHGHWSRSMDDPSTFARSKAGSHGGVPVVTWEIAEFERLWITMAHGAQVAGALYKTFLRWDGTSFGEAWDLQTREELAGRFTLSAINDAGGGFGAFINFTGPGVEERLHELAEIDRIARERRLGLSAPPPASEEYNV